MCLTEQILAAESLTYFPKALENIYAYTRHVEARSDLDPDDIKRLLDRVERLLSVRFVGSLDWSPLMPCSLTHFFWSYRWRYVQAEFRSGRFWVPSDILSPRHSRTKLYIEDLPLRDFNGEVSDTYIKSIPTNMLVSLKMASPAPPLTTRLESLKQLLLHASRIETFHYNDRGQGTRFSFARDERLPAFRELVLRSYDWNHSVDDVGEHWDFSRIRCLKLIDVPMFQFLASIPFSDMANLEVLHCEDFSAHLPDRRQEATHGLSHLIRHIRALSTLKITCHTQQFDVGSLLAHGRTLRVLRFRDHVGFGEEDRRCPTMWIDDLVNLSRSLVNLHTLELDMDVTFCDPPLFLRAICGFARLQTLTLHVQTVLRALEIVHLGTDRDYEAAMRTFGSLVRGKRGLPWRSITINVGGWRRHMLRRLGEAWRERNEQGIYAERCFVLERSSSGDMMLREEMPVESREQPPEQSDGY